MATTYVKDIEDMFKDYARNIIKSISVKHKINYDELLRENDLWTDKKIVLPFCGGIHDNKCLAVRVNHGLYTQCCNNKDEGDFCKTCNKSKSAEGVPKYGLISTRKDVTNGKWMGKKIEKYGDIMKKLNISRQEAEEAAREYGWTIPEAEFEEKTRKKRGRKSAIVNDTDSDNDENKDDKKEEKPKRGRGRPKKEKPEVKNNMDAVLDNLISNSVIDEHEQEQEDDGEIEVIRWPSEDGEYGTKHQYLLDENTGKVYSTTDNREIGSYKGGELTIF